MLGMADKFDRLRKSLDPGVKDFNGLVALSRPASCPPAGSSRKSAFRGGPPQVETVDEPLRALSETTWPRESDESSGTTDWAEAEGRLLEPEIDLTDPQDPPQVNPGDSSAA